MHSDNYLYNAILKYDETTFTVSYHYYYLAGKYASGSSYYPTFLIDSTYMFSL